MVVYYSKAAEAAAKYRKLEAELLLHLRRLQAGWWENDPATGKIIKIEIESKMKVLRETYGSEW